MATPMVMSIVVKCYSCSRFVKIPSNSCSATCICGTVNFEPIEIGYQYVITTCKNNNAFRIHAGVKEFQCKCCNIIHAITNGTLYMPGDCTCTFKKAEVKWTPENKSEEEINAKLKEMKVERQKVEKEFEKMKEEMEKMQTDMEQKMLENNTVECGNCQKKHVLDSWIGYCECSAILLKKVEKGFKYVFNNCLSTVYRLKSDNTWFTCECCNRERIIGNLIPDKLCGQEIYSSELSSSIIRMKDEKIMELTEALEKERKAAEEAKLAAKSVEATLGLEIETLKKENEFLKNIEARTAEMTEVTMAKLCEKVIKPLVSDSQTQQNTVADQEELTLLKKRAEEAEARYFEQNDEMINEAERYVLEIAEMEADYNSVSESNDHLSEMLAETEARCKDLEKKNEDLNNMNESLKKIAEEAEARYFEQNDEMNNEIDSYKNEIAEMEAEYDSLSETNEDILEKLAETEARCEDLEKKNEKVNNMNESLKKINLMAIKNNTDHEAFNRMKIRAEEAETRYLEQEDEMINEINTYMNEIAEMKADYDSLSETNEDLLVKLAEAEARCKDLKRQNEDVNNMNESLKEINLMTMKKINEMAANAIHPGFEKNEQKLQAIIDMQKARM